MCSVLSPDLSGPVQLVIDFKLSGWRRPVQDMDQVEVWSGTRLLARVPGALARQLFGHYVWGALIQTAVWAETAGFGPTAPAAPAADPPDRLPRELVALVDAMRKPIPPDLMPERTPLASTAASDPPTLREAFETLIATLDAQGKSNAEMARRTLRTLTRLFPLWLDWPTARIGEAEMSAFVAVRQKQGLARGTVKNDVWALRAAVFGGASVTRPRTASGRFERIERPATA